MQDKKAARNHFSEKVLSKCNAGLETMALGNNLPQDFGGSDRFDEDFTSPEALVTGPSAWTHSKNSPFKTGRTVPWSPLKGMEAIMLGNMRLIIGVMIALGMLIVSITGRRERLSLKLGP